MQRKQEEFDKKEFGFGRKMLNLKKKEALMSHHNVQQKFPVKVEIDTKVKNEAYIIDSRFNVEQEVRELKKRKIDRMVADNKLKPKEVNLQLRYADESNYLKKALEKSKKKKLKDLIYKYQQALGLTKFFINLFREQNLEKHAKQKHLAEEDRPKSAIKTTSPTLKSKKNVRIVEDEDAGARSPKQKRRDDEARSPSRGRSEDPRTPKRSPRDEQSSRSPKRGTKKDFTSIHENLVIGQKVIEDKRQVKDQIDKNQKKAHNVISLIIDEVEKKIDQERKLLKKITYQKKGGEKARYVDEDEKTYLKFNGNQNDLGKSTHLLRIKRELSEKQFTFEEIVMMRYQMKKQSGLNLDSSKSIK